MADPAADSDVIRVRIDLDDREVDEEQLTGLLFLRADGPCVDATLELVRGDPRDHDAVSGVEPGAEGGR
jgi:hypothetical protein